MRSPLAELRAGRAWSLSELLFGLDDELDDEGRPIGERRAPSHVKRGVEITLRACPYHDERNGLPMNVSALAQITAHLDAVYEEIAGFRRAAGGYSGWQGLLVSVIDLLAGPARHVLAPDASRPVPARAAVGHKLAAGYFGVARALMREHALGRVAAPTIEGVRAHVTVTRALIGSSEVCAGPPGLIERTTAALLDPVVPPLGPLVDEERLLLAELLARQVTIGIAWELFDYFLESELLWRAMPSERRDSRTTTIRRALDERSAELSQGSAPELGAAAVRLASLENTALASRLTSPVGLDGEDVRVSMQLLERAEGAIVLARTEDRRAVAECVAAFARGEAAVRTSLHLLERRIRAALRRDPAPGIALPGLVFPVGRCRRWLEAALGHHIETDPAGAPRATLSSHRRRVEVALE